MVKNNENMRWKAKPLVRFWLRYVVFLSSAWKYRCLEVSKDGTRKQHGSTKNRYVVQLSVSFFQSFFLLFNCCLSVVLQLEKGDYPENLQVVFCPSKYRSFEPFVCLDLVLECQQSFLFQILYGFFNVHAKNNISCGNQWSLFLTVKP